MNEGLLDLDRYEGVINVQIFIWANYPFNTKFPQICTNEETNSSTSLMA